MTNKEKIVYYGTLGAVVAGGIALNMSGKRIAFVDSATTTSPAPLTSEAKPGQSTSGITLEGLWLQVKAINEQRGSERINIDVKASANANANASTSSSSESVAKPVEQKVEPKVEPKVQQTQETVKSPTITEGGKFTVSGLPERVDPKNVLVAKGPDGYGNNFIDTLPFGAEVFAEPGVLKVGPEFPEDKFKALGKSVERFNPANQAVISTEQGSWSVREGGFTVLNGNNMEIEVAGNDASKPFRINLGGDEINHTIVVLRGLFPDKSTPKDRNRTVKIFNHPAGHTLADSYPLGAYISSGHMKQMIENAYTSYPNNGDNGARKLSVFTIDLNTGAWALYVQPGSNGKWDLAGSNWKN